MRSASPGIAASLDGPQDLPFPLGAGGIPPARAGVLSLPAWISRCLVRGESAWNDHGAGWARRAATIALRGRMPGLVIIHVLLFAVIFPLAYYVHFDGEIPPECLIMAMGALPLVVLLKLVVFLATGGHRGWWRYTSFADMTALAGTTALTTIVLVTVGYLDREVLPTPRSVLLLDGAATLLALAGVRGITRLFRERYFPMMWTRRCNRVFVVGASEAGMALVHQIQRQPHLGMRVVGFLDDDRQVRGRTLAGVKVIGGSSQLRQHSAIHRVQTILIPTPAVPAPVVRELVAACDEAKLRVQIVPGLGDLLTGTVTVRPRDVEIQDLLARDSVRLDGPSIDRLIRDRVVLVTGAAGSIGSEICRQALSFGPRRLILLDHSENGLFYLEKELQTSARGTEIAACVASITDPARLRSAFERSRPAVVFHAAAHKHVPMMEINPGEAVKNNVFGTKNVVDESLRSGIETFVLISTDKAVNPSSVMGACKRLAEMYCRSLSGTTPTRLVTVRFGNVLGSAGSVVPIFQEQIRRGGPVTVTHPEMTRYFMTIPEAAQLVLQAGALGCGGEVFVLDMGEPIRIVDLARAMIRLSGFAEGAEIEIVYSGLRPGEKLHEELFSQGEEHVTTPHPKVFAVRQPSFSAEQFRAGLARLARTVEGTDEDVIDALAALVSGYRPPVRWPVAHFPEAVRDVAVSTR